MSRVYQFDRAQEAFVDGPDGTIHPFVPSEPYIPDQIFEFGAAIKVSVVISSTTGTVDVTGSVGANPIEATAPHPGESLEAEKEEASKSKGKRKASKEKRSGKKSKSSKSSKGVFGTAPVEASTAGSAQEVLPAHEPDNPEMCMVGPLN